MAGGRKPPENNTRRPPTASIHCQWPLTCWHRKVEAVHGERFKARSDAKHQVFEYIEVYYNRKRLHSKLGYISPDAFESKKVA